MKYNSLYERLVANTELADPDDASSCWLWTGKLCPGGYPRLNVREAGRHRTKKAHRVMLEEFHQIDFPLDEAGHLCYTPRCINPLHLEVQTALFNLGERRGYREPKGCMIPVLFPRFDALQAAADWAWDNPGLPGQVCPF